MNKSPIEKYLEKTGKSRRELIELLSTAGWRPSRATLSRWIAGKRKPSIAAQAILKTVSGGEIRYD